MAHHKLICIVLFYTVVTAAQLETRPHFTNPALVYEVLGDGKHSVTFEWNYKLNSQVDIRDMYFGFMTGRFHSTAVKKVIRGKNVRVNFLYSGTVMRKLFSDKSREVTDDRYVAVDVMKTRIITGNDRKARFTIKNVLPNHKGIYFCIIRLTNGRIIESKATLNVDSAPPKPEKPYIPPIRHCKYPSTSDCSRIGYQYTSADSDQSQIAKMRKMYEPVTKKKWVCDTAFKEFLCYMYAPKCDVDTKVVYVPCRSKCEEVRRKCEYVWLKYSNYGLSWPASFDCESMPDKYCLGTASAPTRKVICRGKVWKEQCTEPSFVLTITSAQYGRSSKWICTDDQNPFHCQFDVTSIVRTRCGGKRACSLDVNGRSFGNQCGYADSYLSVTYLCQSLWKPPESANTTSSSWLPLRPCRPIEPNKCQSFGYTFTQIPVKFSSTRRVSAVIDKYWPVVQSNCSSDLFLLICSVYVPRCNPLNMVTRPPCRSLCSKVKRDCKDSFRKLGKNWPADFDCAGFPEENCVSSSSKPTDYSSNMIFPRKLTGGGKCQRLTINQCQGLGYQNTILPAIFFYPAQSHIDSLLNVREKLMPSSCSTIHLRFFMCTRYAPKCDASTKTIIPPCRSLCKQVLKECDGEIKRLWGSRMQPLNCSWLPEQNCISSLHLPHSEKFLFVNYQKYVSPTYKSKATFDCSTTQLDSDVTLYKWSRNSWRKVTTSIFNKLTLSMGVFTRTKITYWEMGLYRCKAVTNNWEVIVSPNIHLVRARDKPTVRPPPAGVRLNIQLKHNVQQNATFEFNYHVPLEGELEKIEFLATDLYTGRWIVVVAKYVVRGKLSLGYFVNSKVVRRVLQRRPYQYSHAENLKALKSRVVAAEDREAKFTLTNITLNDKGSYSCKVTLRNSGSNTFHYAYLNVTPVVFQFTQPLPSTIYVGGYERSVNFICTTTDTSAVLSLWHKKRKQGKWREVRKNVVQSGGVITLLSVQSRNVAWYRCIAVNSKRKTIRSSSVRLETLKPTTTFTSPTTAIYYPSPSFSPFPTFCEPLTISACQNFGYNQTAASQLLGGAPQSNRSQWLKQMEPLIKTNCSLDLRRFLCSMTAPPCNPTKNTIRFPCRSFCERIKQGCGASFKTLTGLDWSSAFDCSVMPQSSCVDPSSRPTVGPKCENLTIPLCRNIGYTNASFPNNLTHTTQDEAASEMNQYFPFVIAGCSPKLTPFLCSMFAPPCKADKTYLLPCRELCESAKSGCEGIMNNYGFSWPQHLNCDKLPLESSKQCFKVKALPTMPPTST